MINVTPQFRQALYDGNRNYLETVKITLTDGTVLNLTNEDIWQGSLSFEDAVSSDSDFQIGAAIINKQKLRLNNMYEDFNDYTFEGAEVITNIGLACGANGEVERLRKGTFIVDTADYDETIISLDLLDYMSKFDVPFSEINITFPAQAQEIVNAICSHCGVALGTVNFPHRTFEISTGPEKDTCSCREVIAWVAQICGCFARCDVYGRLELKWYDTNALDSFLEGLDGGVFDETTSSSYQTGDTADGGSFNPWDTGYVYDDGDFTQVLKNVHVISSTFSHSISVDDVVITGVRILVKANSNSESGNEIVSHMEGTAGYVVEISNNELITESNVNDILGWLGVQLIGLTFRKANVSIPSDPSIEAGDVGIIFDRKGNNYPILISKTVFSPFGQQTVVSSAQTPARNSAARYSAETKNYVELRKQIKKSVDDWTAAEQRLSDAITNANGMYQTDITDPQTGAVTHYLHNKGPDGTATDQSGLNASDIRIMVSDVGITMTANGTDPNPVWYGLTVNGTLIAQIIDTIKINFDRGTGGTLTLGGQDNINGLLRMLDANGNQVGEWRNTGLTAKSLTADNYVYVDGNNSSMIRIPYSIDPYYGGHITLSTEGLVINNEKSGINNRLVINQSDRFYSLPLPFYVPGDSITIEYPSIAFIYGNPVTQISRFSAIGISQYGTGDNQSELYPGYLRIMNTFDNQFILDTDAGSLQTYLTNGIFLHGFTEVDDDFRVVKNVDVWGNVNVDGNVVVDGTKSRLAQTKDYGERLLYCYETPTPMFGDIGEGVIGEDGQCYIIIDPTFAETVSTTQYQVFIQKYGNGECYISKRAESYFIVEGTPGLSFGWEIKAKQTGYEERRLDTPIEIKTDRTDYSGLANSHVSKTQSDYGDSAAEHIKEIAHEREAAA